MIKMSRSHFEKINARKSSLNTICILGIISVLSMIVVIPATATPAINVEPSYLKISHNDTFTLNITVNPAGNEIYGAQYDLFFNTSILNATSQTPGTFLSQDGASTSVIINRINNTIGRLEYGETRTGVDDGVTTPGVLASITFKAVKPGTSNLDLSNVLLGDPNGTAIETEVNDGTVVIEGEQPSYPANCVYFLPENSTGIYCQNNTTVQVRVNTTVDCYGPQVDIYFDTSCVNITDVNFTGSPWYYPGCHGWSYPYGTDAGIVRILGCCIDGASGDNLLANITLHCINETCDCTSYLDFRNTALPDDWGDPILHVTHNGTFECKPEIIPGIDLNITAIDAYHEGAYGTSQDPWFNLSNEIAATVENIGTEDAGAFNVCLYINEELIGSKRSVSGLDAGNSTTVHFEWTPIGCDCADGCSPKAYTLKAIADCDDDIIESNENNNELTRQETAYWNGYAADEPLENFVHGKLRGGLLFTTGDSVYGRLGPGESRTGTYNISLPQGAEVELARLNVYYTWVYPQGSPPQMEVKIKNQTGTYVLSVDKKYDDRKCWGGFDLYWGNWVYDVTQYIQESGTYEITVKCTQSSGSVCPAGPGILILYKDETKPMIEYWINEGADVLEVKNGYIHPWEAITNASFKGCINGRIVNASLGIVNPWANTFDDGGELFFNNISLGKDVYCGGMDPNACNLSNSVIYMEVGWNPQVAISLSTVKDYLTDCNNYAGIGDIHDIGMMPSNAFLVVEYEEAPPAPAPFFVYGWVNDSTGAPVLNPNVTITNLNTTEVFTAETNASSNYYQVVTSSANVSEGNVLHFRA
ncbi:DUF3344 domain-containing protein, partial [Methanophagales archaeon]